MKLLIYIYIIFLNSFFINSKEKKTVYDYINKYAILAIKEMEKFHIPASIKLAQGILESSSGNSTLASIANNHFGIKCGKKWKGNIYNYDDDIAQECFRKYSSSFESFRDHSKFLKQIRYKKLFSFLITDYKSWARELKLSGYSTTSNYDKCLIYQIEKFELWRFDKESSNGFENRIKKYIVYIKNNNNNSLLKRKKLNKFKKKNIYNHKLLSNSRIFYHKNKILKFLIIYNLLKK